MLRQRLFSIAFGRPYWTLTTLYLAWKTVLFTVALLSPGRGYDTSTSLLFNDPALTSKELDDHLVSTKLSSHVLQNLVRWDGIYYSSIAHRGHLYEQEWAFSWGFTRLTSFLAHMLFAQPTHEMQAVSAIIISNSSHLLSVFLLYNLSRRLIPGPQLEEVSFICGALHIIAPAGLFTSAPYAESLFSFLHFAGLLLYCKANEDLRVVNDWLVLAAGLLVGLSSIVRSNGVFTGVVFAVDSLSAVLHPSNGRSRRVCVVLLGGLLVGAGFMLPQAIAHHHFCIENGATIDRRPWCDSLPPSIYTFVQSHYWGVGFLRYWTVSNLPLFLLAAPTVALLLVSAAGYIDLETFRSFETFRDAISKSPTPDSQISRRRCLSAIALPQLVLATLALTSFHVQVITRLATGYPLPYIWITSTLLDRKQVELFSQRCDIARLIVYWMVMYGLIQGGLYASFLPPA